MQIDGVATHVAVHAADGDVLATHVGVCAGKILRSRGRCRRSRDHDARQRGPRTRVPRRHRPSRPPRGRRPRACRRMLRRCRCSRSSRRRSSWSLCPFASPTSTFTPSRSTFMSPAPPFVSRDASVHAANIDAGAGDLSVDVANVDVDGVHVDVDGGPTRRRRCARLRSCWRCLRRRCGCRRRRDRRRRSSPGMHPSMCATHPLMLPTSTDAWCAATSTPGRDRRLARRCPFLQRPRRKFCSPRAGLDPPAVALPRASFPFARPSPLARRVAAGPPAPDASSKSPAFLDRAGLGGLSLAPPRASRGPLEGPARAQRTASRCSIFQVFAAHGNGPAQLRMVRSPRPARATRSKEVSSVSRSIQEERQRSQRQRQRQHQEPISERKQDHE